MSSHYVVVQYGNMISGEFLNVGIYTYDLDPDIKEVKSQFVSNLNRVQIIFGKDTILENALDHWLKKIVTKDELADALSKCNSPYSSLQITPPRASILSADDLLKSIASDFLIE